MKGSPHTDVICYACTMYYLTCQSTSTCDLNYFSLFLFVFPFFPSFFSFLPPCSPQYISSAGPPFPLYFDPFIPEYSSWGRRGSSFPDQGKPMSSHWGLFKLKTKYASLESSSTVLMFVILLSLQCFQFSTLISAV